MNERIYIKEELKEMFRNMNLGLIDYIEVYRIENDKYYFTAGSGKFHLTKGELDLYKLA